MKFSTTTLTILSSLSVSLVAASSCTSDVALAWPYTPGTDGSTTDCNGDTTCEELEAIGQCNAQALIDDTQDCVEDTLKRMRAKKLKPKKRQTVDLECESNETCFLFVDNSLLCMDPTNGDYHDDVGGSGNAISGVYTASNGDVQTVTGVTAEPTTTAMTIFDSSPGSSEATTTADGVSQSETAAATTTSEFSSGASSSQSSAAAQETGNVAPVLRLGPAMAAMAAVPMVALVL